MKLKNYTFTEQEIIILAEACIAYKFQIQDNAKRLNKAPEHHKHYKNCIALIENFKNINTGE